jgi:hypothetical protein
MDEKESAFTSGDEGPKDVEEGVTAIGHPEELRRDFSIWSLGSLCLCLMGTVRTLYPLPCPIPKIFMEEC